MKISGASPSAPTIALGKPERIIFSSMQEEGPQYSPDGKRIIFQSTRSGNFEIWRADADGTNLAQLTFFGGPPHWHAALVARRTPDFFRLSSGGPSQHSHHQRRRRSHPQTPQ